jgi:membrane protein DedA with SNARE-associated domain
MFWYLLIAAIIGGSIGFGITYIVCRLLPQEEVRQLNEELLKQEE